MRDVMPRRVDTHFMVDFLKCRFVSVRTVYMPQVFCVMPRGGRHACYDGQGSKGASQWTWGAAENGARDSLAGSFTLCWRLNTLQEVKEGRASWWGGGLVGASGS